MRGRQPRKSGILALAACGLVCGCGKSSAPPAAPAPSRDVTLTLPAEGGLPISLGLVREMESFGEKSWPACREDAYPDDRGRALLDWERKRPWVEKQLTPDLVRALSGWARREMESYTSVPPLSRVTFKPIAARGTGDSHHRILLEGTVDTLPSHSPGTVTRWLKLYLVYNSEIRNVTTAIITIQGEKRE